MAYPQSVKIGIIDSIKIDNYQYVKPSIEVDIALNPGDDFVSTVEKGKEMLKQELKKLKTELSKEKQ